MSGSRWRLTEQVFRLKWILNDGCCKAVSSGWRLQEQKQGGVVLMYKFSNWDRGESSVETVMVGGD